MTFVPIDGELGLQPVAVSSTVQNQPLGYVIRAYDSTLGAGEFIYLKGVVGTVVGSLVTYDVANSTTTLTPTSGGNLTNPVAVSMSANVASQYGWYQIGGPAVIKKTAVKVSPTVSLYLSATAGRVKSTAASGRQILGCKTTNAATVTTTSSTISVIIDRPSVQGQVI